MLQGVKYENGEHCYEIIAIFQVSTEAWTQMAVVEVVKIRFWIYQTQMYLPKIWMQHVREESKVNSWKNEISIYLDEEN